MSMLREPVRIWSSTSTAGSVSGPLSLRVVPELASTNATRYAVASPADGHVSLATNHLSKRAATSCQRADRRADPNHDRTVSFSICGGLSHLRRHGVHIGA